MTVEMKGSGVTWIGMIPENWTLMRLKDCLQICNGREVETDDGLVPVYGSGGAFKWTDKPLCKEPSILFGRKGTIDKPLYVDEPFWTVDTMFYSRNRGNVELEYLYLLATCFNYDYYLSGSTLPSMTQSDLGSILIPFPPRSEQKLIAQLLKTITNDIDNTILITEKQIDVLERYKKSLIHEAVTKGLDPNAPLKPSGVEWIGDIPEHWDTKRMKYISNYWNGLTYEPEDVSDGGMSVMRSGNIQDGRLDFSDVVNVTMQVPEKAMLKKGDTLICSRNGSRRLIGKNAYVDQDGLAFGAFMMVARPHCHAKYFYYLLNSEMFPYYLPTYLTSTVNQLTNTNFGNMVCPLPTEKEQIEISEHLDIECAKIDAIIEIKRKQVEVLKRRRQSLIYEYVTGKRRVGEES